MKPNFMDAVHAGATMVPTKECIPTNNTFSKALGPVIDKLAGSIGGLLFQLAIAAIVLCAVCYVATILSKKAQRFMQALVTVGAVLLGLPLALAIIAIIYKLVNNAC